MPSLVSKPVGTIGYGLMSFGIAGLAHKKQIPDEQAFKAMNTAISRGATFWNSSEFYGFPDPTLNLQLVNRYFTANPNQAEKVVLSVKGCMDLKVRKPTGDPESVRRSVDNVLKCLDGKKFVDIFECARVDKRVPIETTIETLKEYVEAGKIGGIGLSEASEQTIRRAHAVHPIAAVELEVSLWATEVLTNGIGATCAELNIPIVAYSPLGRGFLTGQIKTIDDIKDNALLNRLDRFQPGNFEINIQLVHAVERIAKRKGVTSAQLALGWVLAQGNRPGKPTIIPIPGTTSEERVVENTQPAKLTEEELKEIDEILAKFEVKGGRYYPEHEPLLLG